MRTCPFQVSMHCVVCVKVVKTFCNMQQLEKMLSVGYMPITEESLTKPTRFAPGLLLTYFVKDPFGIHSETNCKGFCVTLMKATTFRCLSSFQMIASL